MGRRGSSQAIRGARIGIWKLWRGAAVLSPNPGSRDGVVWGVTDDTLSVQSQAQSRLSSKQQAEPRIGRGINKKPCRPS